MLERLPFAGTLAEDDKLAGASPIDLTHWQAEHYSPDITPGIWARAPDGMSVEQIQHGDVTLFVSDGDIRTTRFACTMQVLTAAPDGLTVSTHGFQADVGGSGDSLLSSTRPSRCCRRRRIAT